MLADLRFVLGAVLAVTLLAVMGLGVVTSVALMREAHVRPIEDSRSLAYAGPLGRNEFYDPDDTWRSAPAVTPAAQIEAPAAFLPGLPPMPRPRPQLRKHIVRRAAAAPTQSAPDPTATWAPWPFFGPPPAATASAANRSSQPGGPSPNRPQ